MIVIVTASFLYLSLATVLLFGATLIPYGRTSWPLWLRAGWDVGLFLILSLLLRQVIGSPLSPHFTTSQPDDLFWEKIVAGGWWIVGARSAICIARLAIVLEHRPRETKIVSDLVAGVIYIAAVLAIVNFVFAVPIGGLLATSGIIAIVLGLALQSTLSDVFSGIALGVERPYKAGDFIWVEGGIEGQVIHVTWRSTHIETGNNNVALVPNSIIAKARLVNHSLPTTVRTDTIEIQLDPGVPPERCVEALTAAVRNSCIPLAAPRPSVACTRLKGDGALYEIGFSVASSAELGVARTELLTHIHRHLRHAGIALAVAGATHLPPVQIPTPAELLEQSDLFSVLDAAHRDLLAGHLTARWLQPGDTLICQGDTPHALHIIANGTADVTTEGPDGPRLVHRMSPGETIGAIGLITGSPYGATATAITPVKAYQLNAAVISAAIKAEPALAAGLEALAKRAQASAWSDAAATEGLKNEQPELFLSRLRNFLRLLSK